LLPHRLRQPSVTFADTAVLSFPASLFIYE
jgi:hypothetical protein